MKKLVFLLGVLLTMMSATSRGQELSNIYYVGDNIKISRTMLNLTDPETWEPYHLIERKEIMILFLNPPEDFTIETLNYALNNWERISSTELKLMILLDKSNGDDKLIPTFQFEEDDDLYIFHNSVYAIGRVEWEESKEKKKKKDKSSTF